MCLSTTMSDVRVAELHTATEKLFDCFGPDMPLLIVGTSCKPQLLVPATQAIILC